MEHGIRLTDPRLIIADAGRSKRIAERCADRTIMGVEVDLPVEQALSGFLGEDERTLPDVEPDDEATILFTSGSTGESKAAVSTHRAVTTGVYCYATGLMVLRSLLEQEGRP